MLSYLRWDKLYDILSSEIDLIWIAQNVKFSHFPGTSELNENLSSFPILAIPYKYSWNDRLVVIASLELGIHRCRAELIWET